MAGAELEESSTTDGFQHPRIRSRTSSHCVILQPRTFGITQLKNDRKRGIVQLSG